MELIPGFTPIASIAVLVLVTVDALKENYPNLRNNTTRFIALILGGIYGLLAQYGILPIPDANVLSGAFSGLVAVAGVTTFRLLGGIQKNP